VADYYEHERNLLTEVLSVSKFYLWDQLCGFCKKCV
jgi:hypothetical protein